MRYEEHGRQEGSGYGSQCQDEVSTQVGAQASYETDRGVEGDGLLNVKV